MMKMMMLWFVVVSKKNINTHNKNKIENLRAIR